MIQVDFIEVKAIDTKNRSNKLERPIKYKLLALREPAKTLVKNGRGAKPRVFLKPPGFLMYVNNIELDVL